ncbi:MAG TPA: hypothetical protein VF266_20795 [Thermoanaerobaculia bacterium]
MVAVYCVLAIFSGCSQYAPPAQAEATLSRCAPGRGVVDLNCPAPPSTFSTAGLQGTYVGQSWDAWAWSSFAALNWPALATPESSLFQTGFVRGIPDVQKKFVTAQSRDVTVWETFKEKRELFNPLATPRSWQARTFDPKYAPSIHGGEIAMCAGAEPRFAALTTAPRVFARLSKTPSAGGASTEDETAEVASPAQESTNQLCAGYSGKALSDCRQFLHPQQGGNDSTPYTATGPNGRSFPVGPRVFKGTPSAANFLYYEVKVNYDYYAYVAQPLPNNPGTSLNVYTSAIAQAKNNGIFLPYRTSAAAKPSSRNPNAVANYSALATANCYASNLKDCGLAGQPNVSVTSLPALGSIQLKAAWVPVSLLDGNPDDYHLTDAIYYKDSPNQRNGLCYDVQTFGLVGLHIIQRVHAGAPGGVAGSTGGTYIFATWEHQSVGNGADYTYVNYSKFARNTEMPYPNTAAGIQVARLQNYPLPTTARLNAQVQSQLAGSVWANYRLIGTQFQAIGLGCSQPIPPNPDCATQAHKGEAISLALGQPVYLANLVIETNRGLQQFQGQPPGQTPNAHFAGNGVPKNYQFFSPGSANMSFSSQAVNMGGCMGCHGVAQTQGFAFSFVLQDGDKGTVPDTATSISIPPVALPTQ